MFLFLDITAHTLMDRMKHTQHLPLIISSAFPAQQIHISVCAVCFPLIVNYTPNTVTLSPAVNRKWMTLGTLTALQAPSMKRVWMMFIQSISAFVRKVQSPAN
mmetsp:Transcript_9804/g.14614  ORF Transcript_9804/g.14614 Transcript_9804/m.14614 type:complete len:103 (+) Transcript_9804:1273-1581(+)